MAARVSAFIETSGRPDGRRTKGIQGTTSIPADETTRALVGGQDRIRENGHLGARAAPRVTQLC
jgi:hypothetical protein